jgi:hypothetical protein
MSNESRPRKALSYLGSAVWTATSASVLAVVLQVFPPTTDGPAVLHDATHPDTCRVCALSTPEARAVRDASLTGSGAIEAPAASDGLSEGAGPAARVTLTGP